MSKALNLRPELRTRREACIYVMDHSRAGALVQAFIMDALGQRHPIKAATEHRDGETNMDALVRLLDADALLGTSYTFDGLKAHADAVTELGADGVKAAFEGSSSNVSNMINPLAWFRAAEDISTALAVALPDPPAAPKLRDWEEAQIAVVVKNGRFGETYTADTYGETRARAELGGAVDRLLKGKVGRSLSIELSYEQAADQGED